MVQCKRCGGLHPELDEDGEMSERCPDCAEWAAEVRRDESADATTTEDEMTKQELRRRLHAATSALSGMQSPSLTVHDADDLIDVLVELGANEEWMKVPANQYVVRKVTFNILGAEVTAFGRHLVDPAVAPTDPAPASVAKAVAGEILSGPKDGAK
jgi:hypothetical protein